MSEESRNIEKPFDIDRFLTGLSEPGEGHIDKTTGKIRSEHMDMEIANKISGLTNTAFLWQARGASSEKIDELFEKSIHVLSNNEVFSKEMAKQKFEGMLQKNPKNKERYGKYIKFFEEEK